MNILFRKQTTQELSQRATTTGDEYKRKGPFERYLSGQSSLGDLIKCQNITRTKKCSTTFQSPTLKQDSIHQKSQEQNNKNKLKSFHYETIMQRNRQITNISLKDNASKNNYRIKISPDFSNKIHIRCKQITLIKQKHPNVSLQQKLREMKIQNGMKQNIKSQYWKIFRATSDHYINQQNEEINKLGDLDLYEIEPKQIYTHRQEKQQNFIRHRRNNNFPQEINNSIIDESIISETEAKLNVLYKKSRDINKKVELEIKNQENPNKLINLIQRVNSIRENITRVNYDKLNQLISSQQ